MDDVAVACVAGRAHYEGLYIIGQLCNEAPDSKTFGVEFFGADVQGHIEAMPDFLVALRTKSMEAGWSMAIKFIAQALAIHLEVGPQILQKNLSMLIGIGEATEGNVRDEQVKEWYPVVADFMELFDLAAPFCPMDLRILRRPTSSDAPPPPL